MDRKNAIARTITIDAAAQELGISRSSAYLAAHRGELPAIRIGGRILVLRRALNELLEGEQGLATNRSDD
jgi:excisionase family DNA binding protein